MADNINMKTKLGSELSETDRKHALAAFVHRFTAEHKPFWTLGHDKPHFKDDADWLAHTRFAVTKAGSLNRRAKWCESSPTWPQGRPGEYAQVCSIITGAA